MMSKNLKYCGKTSINKIRFLPHLPGAWGCMQRQLHMRKQTVVSNQIPPSSPIDTEHREQLFRHLFKNNISTKSHQITLNFVLLPRQKFHSLSQRRVVSSCFHNPVYEITLRTLTHSRIEMRFRISSLVASWFSKIAIIVIAKPLFVSFLAI